MLSHKLFFCVSVELFSRAVASQVFSPLQRLTSVFGMGTGGPTALKTLTQVLVPRFWLGTRTLFSFSLPSPFSLASPSCGEVWNFGVKGRVRGVGTADWCTSGDSNPGPTD